LLFAVFTVASTWAGTAPCAGATFTSPVDASKPPEAYITVTDLLRSVRVTRSSYTQHKYLDALLRPLVTRGQFLSATDVGVCWRVLEPFESTFVITPQFMIERQGDEVLSVTTAEDQPMIYEMIGLFMTMHAVDRADLDMHFQVYFDGSPAAWTIGLIPKSRRLHRVVSCMTITGGTAINVVEYHEPSGDRTRIQFTEVRHKSEQLTDDELLLFAK
jgi:hypothetical protein